MASSKKVLALNVIRGGIVGDASCMGSHWIYDETKLADLLKSKDKLRAPEFFEPPSCPFYNSNDFPGHYEAGSASPYGEQALAFMNFLVESKGKFDGVSWSNGLYAWSKKFSGRADHATTDFIANYEKAVNDKADVYPVGANDKQANCFFKVPQLNCLIGDGDLKKYMDTVEIAIRAHQNNDDTVDYAKAYALMLRALVYEGKSLSEAVLLGKTVSSKEVQQATEDGWSAREKLANADAWDTKFKDYCKNLSEALYDKITKGDKSNAFRPLYSKSCAFPQSYQVSLKILGDTFETLGPDGFKSDGYEFAMRRNIIYGGDACGRSFLLGGLLEAAGAAAPDSWVKKATDMSSLEAFAALT